jgi:hypothetical protein
MNTGMNEQELLRQLAKLPREITPEHDVWPEIMSRIDGSGTVAGNSRDQRWRFLAIAAGFLVAFAVGLLLGPRWLASPAGVGEERQMVESGTTENFYSPNLSAVLAATEMEYQAAFREFMAVGDSRDRLAPLTVEKIMMSWEDMRQSEARLTDALLENPGNAFLNSRMMELRSRQLQFLQQIAALDHDSRRISI